MNLTLARNIVLQVAPELRTKPLYVVRHPAGIPIPCRANAFAEGITDGVWRQYFVDRGEWLGPGRVISIVNVKECDLLGIVLHETAHLLPARDLPADVEPTKQELTEQLETREREAVTLDPFERDDSPAKWFPHHDDNFTRLAAHLWWRAALLCGHVVAPISMSVAGAKYDLSPFDRYLSALGCEPLEMQTATFREIIGTEPPAAFTALWKDDLASNREWQRKQKRMAELDKERELEHEYR